MPAYSSRCRRDAKRAVVGFYRPLWDVAVEVNNLTDKMYFTTALGAGARVGDPRSVFLKAGIRH